ncbi:MAG TPA: ABC transporter permease [Acidimicrobiales bacterium]|nr:ABC transporter permease [Acidimicrobiales bacterium]
MRTVWLVLKREVRTRIASKPFLISTVISAAVLIAIVVVIGATAGDGTVTYDLGVVGTRPAAVAAAAQDLAAGDEGAVLDIQQLDDRAEAERLVEAGDLDAALVGDDLVVKVEPDPRLGTLLQAAHREVALGAAVREANVEAPPKLAVAPLEPDDQSEDRGTVAFIGVVLLYAQILGFGYWVASGIVEEKASRVVEILLAKARSSHLLAGKLVGIGTLGLAQLAVLVASGLGTALILGQVDLPPGTYGLAAAVGAWFVLGYALYSCLFAVAGAIASRPEELQGTTMPLSLLTMTGFFAAIFAQEDPTGVVARVGTFFPPSAPLVMPIRQAAGELPLWEAALGVALVLATIAVAIPLAGRIYAGGALFTRGRLRLRDAYAGGA